MRRCQGEAVKSLLKPVPLTGSVLERKNKRGNGLSSINAGGYQVLKKWLSYREYNIVGRGSALRRFNSLPIWSGRFGGYCWRQSRTHKHHRRSVRCVIQKTSD